VKPVFVFTTALALSATGLWAQDQTADVQKWNAEGSQLLDKGKLGDARLSFEKVLAADPDNFPASFNLGSLEYRAHHLEDAEKSLQHAVRLRPDSALAWLTLGVVECDQEKNDAALAALAQALVLEPNNVKAHAYLGVTIGRKGWLDGAEAELRRALELDENDADAHFNLAVIYLQQHPPAIELAKRHYQRALELGASPDSLVEKQLGQGKE